MKKRSDLFKNSKTQLTNRIGLDQQSLRLTEERTVLCFWLNQKCHSTKRSEPLFLVAFLVRLFNEPHYLSVSAAERFKIERFGNLRFLRFTVSTGLFLETPLLPTP